MILCFDVTDRISHIAWQGKDGIAHYQCLDKVKATEILLPTIDAMIRRSGESLERVGVVKGPGAFTGIRVGLATAHALALALNVEVLGFTRFELLEHEVDEGLLVMPSGRDAAYVQQYRDGRCFEEPALATLSGLKTRRDLVSLVPIEGLESRVLDANMTLNGLKLLASGARRDDHDLEPLYLRPADAIAGTSLLAKLLAEGGQDA